MNRPRLLDLCCCAGGCSVGYARAGFEVVGVDHAPQPHYPFEFHRADALRYPLDGFDVIAASPPCKLYTSLRQTAYKVGLFDAHPDVLTPMRARLIESGLPYVIENVPGAPLVDPLVLCGSMFGLGAECADGYRQLRRHRLFESNLPLVAPGPCDHSALAVGVYGSGGADTRRAEGRGGPHVGGTTVSGQVAADALGIDWTTDQTRLSQAIPPAYTEFIGRQLLDNLAERAA